MCLSVAYCVCGNSMGTITRDKIISGLISCFKLMLTQCLSTEVCFATKRLCGEKCSCRR